MGRIKIAGICLLVALSSSAAIAASASAEIPELGRCVKVTPVEEGKKKVYSGQFNGKTCLKKNPKGKGHYEFLPGPGANNKFYGVASEETELETTGGVKISCSVAIFKGEYTGAKTLKTKISLSGCEEGLKRPCQTNPAKEGEIESLSELEGELGTISKASKKPSVGWDLKHEGVIFAFQCGKLPEGINLETIEGPSVIGEVRPGFFSNLDKMSIYSTTRFSEAAGKQIPESFEGGTKDTLLLDSTTEKTSEQVGLTALDEATSGLGEPIESEANQEPLEIKAIER